MEINWRENAMDWTAYCSIEQPAGRKPIVKGENLFLLNNILL
jgi:hypothetical protein